MARLRKKNKNSPAKNQILENTAKEAPSVFSQPNAINKKTRAPSLKPIPPGAKRTKIPRTAEMGNEKPAKKLSLEISPKELKNKKKAMAQIVQFVNEYNKTFKTDL